MKSKQSKQRINPELPTIDQLKTELGREKYKRRYRSVFRSTIYTLIVVAAAAVLLATVWMPVLQIYGGSRSPMINEGDIVLAIKGSDIKNGELAAFYIGNKILVFIVIDLNPNRSIV